MKEKVKLRLNDNEYDLQNIFITGNTQCGKTTIARSFISQLQKEEIEIYVVGDKAYVDYRDLNVHICDAINLRHVYYIYGWNRELKKRMVEGYSSLKVIIIDDVTSLLYYPTNTDESINRLCYLVQNGPKYGMYFIILSQRICKSTFKSEFRKNTSLHIYMRCNNAEESRFLIGNDSLVSLKRGEFKIESYINY